MDVDSFFEAVSRNDLDLVETYFQANPAWVDVTNHGGYTALQLAAFTNNLPLARLCCARAPDPENITSAYDLAQTLGHLELALYLFEKKPRTLDILKKQKQVLMWAGLTLLAVLIQGAFEFADYMAVFKQFPGFFLCVVFLGFFFAFWGEAFDLGHTVGEKAWTLGKIVGFLLGAYIFFVQASNAIWGPGSLAQNDPLLSTLLFLIFVGLILVWFVFFK